MLGSATSPHAYALFVFLQKRTIADISVEVRKSQHKYIVGPRGLVLQEILLTTGVWVEVPSADVDSHTITLHGPQEKLGQALTQVCGFIRLSYLSAFLFLSYFLP